MSEGAAQRFGAARRDPALAVLEGFHAVKHALRFGAEIVDAVAADEDELSRLAAALAPDVVRALAGLVVPVDPAVVEQVAPRAARTGIVAIARRPSVDVGAVLATPEPRPVVLLEDPRTMGNLGACVRVAAASDAAAVLTTGVSDPWHPDAVRGAAGLHFALPVARVDEVPADRDRLLVAVDPEGDELRAGELPARAIYAFGTERDGLSAELLAGADMRLRIPMREGVSSLNLATAVSAVLYVRSLSAEPPRRWRRGP